MRSACFRGCLPLKVVFIETFFWLWCGPMSLYLKFEQDPISSCWDIQVFIFWGHLPLEVFFHWRLSSLKSYLALVWSHELMFKIWRRSDQWLFRYFHFLTSSSIRGHLPLKVIFIETLLDFENNDEVEELFEDDKSFRTNIKMYLRS